MGKVILLLFNIICCIATAKSCVPLWGQCGGLHHTGSTECCSGSTCVFQNDYYSQCLDAPGGPSQPATNPPNSGDRQNGVTTRYWDCCKASCSWRQKASVSSPVQTCAQDGVNSVDFDARSVCDGGNAHMCHNQQPWNVSENLSYGYAAAYLSGKQERDWCCACYSLIFTSGPVAGKEMIVQVTNTGGDLGENHFDLQIPGGGFGIFDGCTAQFPEVASSSWGERYGGISRRSDCKKLPVPLRKGCFWRFDWFQNADNPKMTLKEVPCPDALTAKTGCIRQ